MNNPEAGIFLISAIALLIVVVLYILFRKKTANSRLYRKLVFLVTVLAFFFNLAWELIQGPLYEGYQYNIRHISLCVLASVADAVMVLLIYLGVALFLKNAYWGQHLTARRLLLVMLIGGTGAILAEKRHLAAGSWDYTPSMPVIPVIEAGLSPVLQFTVLPVLIYFLSFYFLKVK